MNVLSFLNKFQKHFSTHVLLYHATFPSIPLDLSKGLHNVCPDELYLQLKWMKSNFDFVFVDDLFDKPEAGKVAITFDDAYLSALSEGFDVLKSLNVPAVVFVNGVSLEGKAFWRDKIRYILHDKLVDQFLDFAVTKYPVLASITAGQFYLETKSPSINSATIDRALSAFFTERGFSETNLLFCVGKPDQLPEHPLLMIGNHTYNHYVLSSLSKSEQLHELKRNQELLQGLNRPLSKVLSIPFGRSSDFNEHTIELARSLGFKGFLYSRNRLNLGIAGPSIGQQIALPSLERYMVPSSFKLFQKHILKLFLKGVGRYR